ncbi:MAG: hypothetical protein JSR80_00455 [Verrucomicrobia bacterium]|nr:hypothetical protein [Verrucomicrobiota bacterium]
MKKFPAMVRSRSVQMGLAAVATSFGAGAGIAKKAEAKNGIKADQNLNALETKLKFVAEPSKLAPAVRQLRNAAEKQKVAMQKDTAATLKDLIQHAGLTKKEVQQN